MPMDRLVLQRAHMKTPITTNASKFFLKKYLLFLHRDGLANCFSRPWKSFRTKFSYLASKPDAHNIFVTG
jgi:hypothetical protein